jgi:outer membrane protein, heavy metal efflux system
MKWTRTFLTLCMPIAFGIAPASAQQSTSASQALRPQVTFADYIDEVLRANPDLAAQKTNVAIAQAQVTTASARPDWTFDVGLPGVDVSNRGAPTTTGVGFGVPMELGGKRGARIRSARADASTVTSDYEDAVRQLRATAANAFIDALTARAVLQSKNRSLAQLERIVSVNQERVRAGDIGEIELAQSRVERDQFRAEVIGAESDVFTADLVFAQQLGDRQKLTSQLPVPSGKLDIATRSFDIAHLVAQALESRPDALARTRAVRAAEERIHLARANLTPDVSLGGLFQHTGVGTGGFSQPPDYTIGATVSFNLPFSRRRYPGELETALATRRQADLQLRSVQLRVETEVRQAYERYQASVRQLNVYSGGLLRDADRVLEVRLYAYQRGGATLLEVIDAQRKSAEIYLAYSQALADHARTLVALEEAAGIWDVSF